MANPVLNNTFYQILTKVVSLVIALITRKLLTVYLGPASYGDYGLILVYTGFFTGVADWGTQFVGIRQGSQAPHLRPQIFGSIIGLKLITSLVICITSGLILPFLPLNSDLVNLLILSNLLVLLFSLKAAFGMIFDTFLRTDRWFFVELVTSVSTLSLVWVVIYLKLSLLFVILGLGLSTLLGILVAYYFASNLSKISLKNFKDRALGTLSEAFPLGSVLVISGLYNRVDSFLLSVMVAPAQVGHYILAYQVYDNLVYFASYFTISVLPVLASSKSKARVKVVFQSMYDLLLIFGLVVSVLTFLFAPILVSILSDVSFIPSVSVLRILSVGLFLSYLNHGTGYTFISLGLHKQNLQISLLALQINLLLNILLIPKYGIFATAYTTIITSLFIQACSLYIINRYLGASLNPKSVFGTLNTFINSRDKLF